jgi:hypothetical protein
MEEPAFTGVESKLDFNIYPNPARDVILIALSQPTKESDLAIKIYDLSGRMVLSQNLLESNGSEIVEININDLSSGLYLVQVNIGNYVSAKRLVISK